MSMVSQSSTVGSRLRTARARIHRATKTFRETTAEAVIKRATAHYHEHHCGPESIIPEIEAAIRRGMVEV